MKFHIVSIALVFDSNTWHLAGQVLFSSKKALHKLLTSTWITIAYCVLSASSGWCTTPISRASFEKFAHSRGEVQTHRILFHLYSACFSQGWTEFNTSTRPRTLRSLYSSIVDFLSQLKLLFKAVELHFTPIDWHLTASTSNQIFFVCVWELRHSVFYLHFIEHLQFMIHVAEVSLQHF